ncbi:chemotaxis protein CheB [Sesbania bispinosa]|nr:chemotaxis protein CheB [Sesbania bispinosa]
MTTPTNPTPLPINKTLAFGGQMAGSAGPKITTPAVKKVTPVAPTYALWSSKPSGAENQKQKEVDPDPRTLQPTWLRNHTTGVFRFILWRVKFRPTKSLFGLPRHIEENFTASFELLKQERQVDVKENKVFAQQVQNLNEKLEATTKDLDTTTENLKVEKQFMALVYKEKASLKKDFDCLKEQVKNSKHSYLEAKSEAENSKEDLEEAIV